MLDLMKLTEVPKPLATVFYYDGDMNYLSVVDGEIVYLAMREQPVRSAPDAPYGYFIGILTEAQVRSLVTGEISMCEVLARHCRHVISQRRGEPVKVFVCTHESYAHEYLPHKDARYEYTILDSVKMIEAQRQKAIDNRTAAEKKIIALNKQAKPDVKAITAQQQSCEFFDQQAKALEAKLNK